MSRYFVVSCLAVFMLVAGACKRPSSETYVADEGSLGLDIEPVTAAGGALQFIATYNAQGKTARFRIEFGQAKSATNADAKAPNFEFGKGKFIAEPDSDASVLLPDLAEALEAKTIPTKAQRTTELPFNYATLGEHMSQSAQGGFSGKPAGNWTTTKIFIEQGEQEGEVYLNFNPVIRKAQFSIKDPEYDDFLLAQLAKVL
jgi:hypothetical protein